MSPTADTTPPATTTPAAPTAAAAPTGDTTPAEAEADSSTTEAAADSSTTEAAADSPPAEADGQATDDGRPTTDDRHPAEAVAAMVDHVLDLAATWTRWDGTPFTADADDGPRTYTPHKAIRRVADHMVDHLAEIEARLAGEATIPDHWHASAITTDADRADFTDDDLDEARSRLTRLAQIWTVRLRALDDAQLDAQDPARPDEWTLREVAFHLTGSTYYADAVGRL